MATAVTISQIAAFKTEIEKNLRILREEARSELRDTRALGETTFAGGVHDRLEEAMQAEATAMNLANLSRHAEEIKDCVEALHRIEQGEYGLCMECGEDIELNRLKANPMAEYCLSCQARAEQLPAAG